MKYSKLLKKANQALKKGKKLKIKKGEGGLEIVAMKAFIQDLGVDDILIETKKGKIILSFIDKNSIDESKIPRTSIEGNGTAIDLSEAKAILAELEDIKDEDDFFEKEDLSEPKKKKKR